MPPNHDENNKNISAKAFLDYFYIKNIMSTYERIHTIGSARRVITRSTFTTRNRKLMLSVLVLIQVGVNAMSIPRSRPIRMQSNHYHQISSAKQTNTPILTKNEIHNHNDNDNNNQENLENLQELKTRRNIFQTFAATSTFILLSTVTATTPKPANAIPEQKSYSSNARNFERLSSGDSSGGSTYNNSPDLSSASAKRRAMVGCKVSSSRTEASRLLSLDDDNVVDESKKKKKKFPVLSEKDCNTKVMGGDSEFMLNALRNLDCPSCPYGIEGA